MGRDDNKRVGGLAGGAAPARAFAAFMKRATRNMPVVPLNSDIQLEDGFAEPDAEVYGLDDSANLPDGHYRGGPDYDGNVTEVPVGSDGAALPRTHRGDGSRLDNGWLEEAVPGEAPDSAPPNPM